MKKKGKIMKLDIILGSILLIFTLLICVFPCGNPSQEKASSVLSFIEPAFAQEMGVSFLEEEAGIVAYTNTGQKIDLTKAKNAFKITEKETPSYILGLVALPNYPEIEDVHILVHADGWIIAYYLRDESIGKIVDWVSYDGGKMCSTKLEKGLAVACDAIEVGLPYVNYYSFKYPNTNRLMIVVGGIYHMDDVYDVYIKNFSIKIPGDFTVYERAWSHYQYDTKPSSIKIDGNTINSLDFLSGCSATEYGQIIPTQLYPDVFHDVCIYCDPVLFKCCDSFWGNGNVYVAIVLIYQEPITDEPSSRIIVQHADSTLTLNLESFSPSAQQTPSPTSIQTPAPVISPIPSEYPTPTLKPGEPYVHLYGHKTNVIVGEEVILYLSVINPITSLGTLKVQLTLQVPSGWSITSGEFSPPVGGFQTAVYDIEQGPDTKTIGIHMLANQPFDGLITGYTDYYFVEQPETKYHKEVNEPVTARQMKPSASAPSLPSVTPNGGISTEIKSVIIAIIVATIGGVLARAIWSSIKKRREY